MCMYSAIHFFFRRQNPSTLRLNALQTYQGRGEAAADDPNKEKPYAPHGGH